MATNNQLKIFQVFHKDSDTIIDAPWVEPLSVGNYRNPRMGSTHLLDNINHLNEFYNELTAIYWVWKNLNYDYVGFYHYRRVLNFRFDKTWSGEFGFSLKNSHRVRQYFGSPEQRECLMSLLQVAPVVIPRLTASERTTSGHYKHFHDEDSWDIFIGVLKEMYPSNARVTNVFDASNLQTSFNMFVMRRDCFNDYCEQLFAVVDEVFRRRGLVENSYMKRYPGFLAERFLHIWMLVSSKNYLEVPIILLGD
jgi:hypothetical protein